MAKTKVSKSKKSTKSTKSTKVKKSNKKTTQSAKIHKNANQIEHLETLIRITSQSITAKNDSVDQFLTQQNDKILKEIQQLRSEK